MKTKAPKSTVRASGGNPNGMPNYRPINKLPDHEIRALLQRSLRPQLYQVFVEDIRRGNIAVSPKCPEHVASALAGAIQVQIGIGAEQVWSNPRVEPVL